MPVSDPSSVSNISNYKVSKLDWCINVDFSSRILTCNALQKFECLQDGSQVLILDTRDLDIELIQVDGEDVEYKLLKEVEPLGKPLEVNIPSEKSQKGSTFDLFVKYKTSPKATALQWLPPDQTLGKKYPYMYTQCQAIHARSLLPCQDSPGCKFIYSAEVTVPENMVALMSAVKGEESSLQNSGKKVCKFEQNIPIPSYLLAIVVGTLEFRTVGPRSKVWCESEMVDACEYEFADVENMIKTAESLMGPYVWGEYDMVILPPSFPYGGMENPCLTFVTPTIIAGDRSLTNVIVHEITHSWTGNLVTNQTWEHFWLNEGFTRFIEDKIIGILEGEKMRQFMGIGGWHSLIDSVEVFGKANKLTALTPELNGIDPDDAFSSIPYEKGSSFLFYIESLVGGADVFNPFLKSYINTFKYKTVVTDDFKRYLQEYFKDKLDILSQIDWESWLHSPGMPHVNVIEMYDTTLSNACEKLCERWVKASESDLDIFSEDEFKSFTTAQKIDFLTKLFQQKPLGLVFIKKMAEIYRLFTYNVSEIEFAFLRLCIQARWCDAYNRVVKFILKLGRMKFVRPLYREMYKYEESRELAVETFRRNKHIYHSLTSALLAKDLHLND